MRLGARLRLRDWAELLVLEVGRERAASVDVLSDDWEEMSSRHFDIVFAALVMQHVEPDRCRQYFADFARMARLTYLLTRLQSDFGENVLRVVADSRLFDIEECAEVEHDASRHILRQVAPRSCADLLQRQTDNQHYEVRLRSRVWTGRSQE